MGGQNSKMNGASSKQAAESKGKPARTALGKTASTALVTSSLASTHLPSDLFSILPFFSMDVVLLILKYCDLPIQIHHANFSFIPKQYNIRFLSAARDLYSEFKDAVFNVEQDEKLKYKAATMIEKHPDLASLKMRLELPDGSIVEVTALQKLIFSLDSCCRAAVIEAMLATKSYTKEDIKQQIQHHVDEADAGKRPRHVNMQRWNEAYQGIIKLMHKKKYDEADKRVVSEIGKVQADIMKLAPNIFPHQFCTYLPLYPCPDFASELAEYEFKRSFEIADFTAGRFINLITNSGLGSRFYVARGHREYATGYGGVPGESRKQCMMPGRMPASDFEAIAAYVKYEILNVERLFNEYQITRKSSADVLQKHSPVSRQQR